MRLRFWLFVMDVTTRGRWSYPIYLWAVGKASAATEWGEGIDCGDTGGEGPF